MQVTTDISTFQTGRCQAISYLIDFKICYLYTLEMKPKSSCLMIKLLCIKGSMINATQNQGHLHHTINFALPRIKAQYIEWSKLLMPSDLGSPRRITRDLYPIYFFHNPLYPPYIHHSYIWVRCTDGAARIFNPIPPFHLTVNKSPVSRVTPSHWERESSRGRSTAGEVRSTKISGCTQVWTPAACVTGKGFIHCTMPLRLISHRLTDIKTFRRFSCSCCWRWLTWGPPWTRCHCTRCGQRTTSSCHRMTFQTRGHGPWVRKGTQRSPCWVLSASYGSLWLLRQELQ